MSLRGVCAGLMVMSRINGREPGRGIRYVNEKLDKNNVSR